jgi:hypothetical protein
MLTEPRALQPLEFSRRDEEATPIGEERPRSWHAGIFLP